MRRLLMRAAFIATALVMVTVPSAGASQARLTANECITWSGHVFAACTSYVAAAHGVLQPYFRYVRSDSLVSGLKNAYTSGSSPYSSKARKTIAGWAAQQGRPISGWPKHTTNRVLGPDITIVSASASLKCNKAVLVTSESWTVVGQGRILYKLTKKQQLTVVLRGSSDGLIWKIDSLFKGNLNLKPTC